MMVAEMAYIQAGDNGDADVHTSDNKGILLEDDDSGSENTDSSMADSSEEDEGSSEDASSKRDGDNEEVHPEPASTEAGIVDSSVHLGTNWYEKIHFKSQCEKCKAAQQMSDYDKITPRRISMGKYQVQLEGEGTYECSVTGLVFEVSEQALVRYSVLSWSKFATFLQESKLKFAGPIFNVDVVKKDASVLKSILFPHSLCVSDPKCELKFSVLHIKNCRPLIEPSVDHSGSHVRWRVTSLSPVGPVVDDCQPVEHHGAVLVYKALGLKNTFSFRVYLATNNMSEITDIRKQVRTAQRRYMKIDKPAICNLDAKKYQLISVPDGEISPTELKFTFDAVQIKGYFEAYFEQPPPFTLSLKEANTDDTVWFARIREEDCEEKTVVRARKKRRGNGSSASEEEINKKSRRMVKSDGNKKNNPLSERQLLLVAKMLGKEWEQMAIILDLTIRDLSEIKAEAADVTMQKLSMLVRWSNRRPRGQATAQLLLSSLTDMTDLSSETEQLLNDLMNSSVDLLL